MHHLIMSLLCTAHVVSAFECDIVLLTNTQISVSSSALCEYTNYHMFMLAIFGFMAGFSILYTCMLAMCRRDDPEAVRSSAYTSFVLLELSLGLEAPVVCILTLLLTVFLYGALVDCVQRLPRFHVQISIGRVVPLSAIAVEPQAQTPPTDQVLREMLVAAIQEAIRQQPPQMNFVTTQQVIATTTIPQVIPAADIECPICYETDLSDEPGWSRTRCGHTFHTVCLNSWRRFGTTCPLCRQDLYT